MEELRDKKGLTEAEFLASYNPDKYPKPSVTADICVLAESGGQNEILLIRRGGHPFLGCWALPGGFAEKNEPVEKTAERELFEETGIKNIPMELAGVYSAPGRDPRGWVISAAYYAVVNKEDVTPAAGDDAADARWFALEEISGLKLAFDHRDIINDAVKKSGIQC